MKQLSDFVKECRKEVNLTQEDFVERVGVAPNVVRKIEQGKPIWMNPKKEVPLQHKLW